MIYLAGPITNNPQFVEQFATAAAKLREQGRAVINPAENPEPPCKTWAGYMRLSLQQLLTCSEIALLPGWEHSEGARLESHVASLLGMPAIYL